VQAAQELTHSPRYLSDPVGWVLYLSHLAPQRLVVFVHGFYGGPLRTWQRFPDSQRAWWHSSDLLFVGYDSRRDNITGTAARLRRHLPRFYPELPDEHLRAGGVRVRATATNRYGELLLVGHSLGGVVLRRALCDVAQEWIHAGELDGSSPKPALLDAQVRLFSPASAGFRPAGLVGLMRSTPAWFAANMVLRRSSAFTDLEPNSEILNQTRQRTESLIDNYAADLGSLRARILWANPDNVVVTERYRTDMVDDAVDSTTHRSVCKPHDAYHAPWLFVETGKSA